MTDKEVRAAAELLHEDFERAEDGSFDDLDFGQPALDADLVLFITDEEVFLLVIIR